MNDDNEEVTRLDPDEVVLSLTDAIQYLNFSAAVDPFTCENLTKELIDANTCILEQMDVQFESDNYIITLEDGLRESEDRGMELMKKVDWLEAALTEAVETN